MIIFWRNYTTTLKKTVHKQVVCESCKSGYGYNYLAVGTGIGASLYYLNNNGASKRSKAAAIVSLEEKIERGADAVPCPKCDWLQKSMRRTMGLQMRRWLIISIIISAVAILLLNFIAMVIPWPWGKYDMDQSSTMRMLLLFIPLVISFLLSPALAVIAPYIYDPNHIPILRRLHTLRSDVTTLSSVASVTRLGGMAFPSKRIVSARMEQLPLESPTDQPVAANKIAAVCSTCGVAYRVKPEMAGKRVRCNRCKNTLSIPHANPWEADTPFGLRN